jgi:hypothetical protein
MADSFTNVEILKPFQTALALSRDLSLDLFLGIERPTEPTGCFLTDNRFFLVPFLVLAVVPLFFVAIGFLQFAVI